MSLVNKGNYLYNKNTMVAPTNNYLDVLEKKKEELEKEENTITYPKSIKLGEHTLKIGDAADKDHSLVVKKIEKTGDKISLKLGYSNETDEEETVKIDLLKISTENEETKTDWMQESGNPITLIFTKKEFCMCSCHSLSVVILEKFNGLGQFDSYNSTAVLNDVLYTPYTILTVDSSDNC